MFSIPCNFNDPINTTYLILHTKENRYLSSESFKFVCMDCGQKLRIKRTAHGNLYSKVKFKGDRKIKQFLYLCLFCGSFYAGYVVVQTDSIHETNRHALERIYFDIDEVEELEHKTLIDKYINPSLIVINNRGDLGMLSTNVKDKLNKNSKAIPITPEDAVFGDMEMGR